MENDIKVMYLINIKDSKGSSAPFGAAESLYAAYRLAAQIDIKNDEFISAFPDATEIYITKIPYTSDAALTNAANRAAHVATEQAREYKPTAKIKAVN